MKKFSIIKSFLFFLLLINFTNIAKAKCSFNCDKFISSEANKISKQFEFKQIGLVALDVKEKLKIVGQNELKKRCWKTSYYVLTPKVINDVKAPEGYGLDKRFNEISSWFRKSSAQCLGGNIKQCNKIHQYALNFSQNSKINKPRKKDGFYWNDTLSVSMRLTGPMAMALGIAWNKINFPKDEKKMILKWLDKIDNNFEHGMRTNGYYKGSYYGNSARKAGHNHAAQSSIARMSIGALTGNKKKFLTGIDQWFITLDTMRKDGSLPIETRRGARALFYQGRTISALIAIAERALVQGIDLYTIDRSKSIHKAVQFYLDVADNPELILKYAKKNKSPGPSKDYSRQDLGGAYRFNSSGHGWVQLYLKKFPHHKNTNRLLNISNGKSHISESLEISVSQKGKSTEWITLDTSCFNTD